MEDQYQIPLELAEKLQRLAEIPEYQALLTYLEEYKFSVDDRLYSTPIKDVGAMAMTAAEWKGTLSAFLLVKAVPGLAKGVLDHANSKVNEED